MSNFKKYRFTGTDLVCSTDVDGDLVIPDADSPEYPDILSRTVIKTLITVGGLEEVRQDVVVRIPAELADEFIEIWDRAPSCTSLEIANLIKEARDRDSERSQA